MKAKLENGKLITFMQPDTISGDANKYAKEQGFKDYFPSYEIGQIVTYNETETEIYEIRTKTFEQLKQDKLNELIAFDSSDAVNQFSIGADNMWLPKSDRVSIRLTLDAVISEGIETHTLWNIATGKSYTLPVASFVYMLMKLESYAYTCFNATAQHTVNINSIENEADLLAYDFTLNYPPKLNFE